MYPRPPIFAIFSVRDACGRRLRRSALSPAVSDARLGAMAEVRAAIPAST